VFLALFLAVEKFVFLDLNFDKFVDQVVILAFRIGSRTWLVLTPACQIAAAKQILC